MNKIEIKEQPRLSVARTFGMTISGMRHRLSRSMVTLVVIIVAIAFMMNTLSESILKRSVSDLIGNRASDMRVATTWADRLSRPGTIYQILEQVAATQPGDPVYLETRAMGGLDEGLVAKYRQHAIVVVDHLRWLETLTHGQRRRLVHNAMGMTVFDRLQDPAKWIRFTRELEVMRSVRLPATHNQLHNVRQAWPQIKQHSQAIRTGRHKAITQVASQLDDRSIMEALQDAEGDFGDAIRSAGFQLDAQTAAAVATRARQTRQIDFLEKTIAEPSLRRSVAAYLDLLPGQVDTRTFWRLLRDQKKGAWYLSRLKEHGISMDRLNASHLALLARNQLEEMALSRVLRVDHAREDRVISERMAWLVLVSVIVCVAGIANAMLMSVTQRFREIATLKCLGALDGYIALSYILEACMLGVVGGLAGALIGLLIALGRMLSLFRIMLIEAIPYSELFVAVIAVASIGVVLAGMATVFPALKAARLAPMEAMRIE